MLVFPAHKIVLGAVIPLCLPKPPHSGFW